MLGAELRLHEDVRDLVVLGVVLAEAVGLEAAVAGAERELLVDAGEDPLARPAVSSSPSRKPPCTFTWSRLKSGLNSLNESAPGPWELIRKRLLSPRLRLDGCRVEGLEHLRLEELADPRDLVAGQGGVGVGEQAVGRVVGRVGVDRVPALDERPVLEAEVGVDAAEAGAAGGEVGVEQQPRAVDRAVVVQLDRPAGGSRAPRPAGWWSAWRSRRRGTASGPSGPPASRARTRGRPGPRACPRSRPCPGSCAGATGPGRG